MKTKSEARDRVPLDGRGLRAPVPFAVLWGVLTLSIVSAAGAQEGAALDEMAGGVEASEVQSDEWPFSDLDPVLQAAVRSAVVDDDVRRAVSSLATTADLDVPAARALLYAVLQVLREPFPETCEEAELPGEVEAEMLAALVGEEPPPVVIAVADLALAEAWRCPMGDRTLAALSAHRSAETAFALASSEESWAVREDLLQVVDDVNGPSSRVLLLRASDLEGVDRASALEAANELAEAGHELPDDLPGRRLAALFNAGLWARALALLDEQGEEALTAAVLADGDTGDSERVLPRQLDVAAAALLAGRRNLARERLASRGADDLELPGELSAGTDQSWKQRRRREAQALRVRLWQAIESAALGTGLADPFDCLAELALAADSHNTDLASRGTLLLFLSDLSHQLGFESLAGFFRQPLSRQLSAGDFGVAPWRGLLARELATSMGQVVEDVESRSGEAVAGDLAGRVPAGFHVRPLSSDELGDAPPEPSLAEVPGGFGVVRSERGQGMDVALAVSQALDPVGEVSTGAYWILRSANGGVSWEVFPTGLRVGAPYEAFAPSRLPMLTPDGLAVEVRWAALDESSITFPPTGVEVERRENPAVVDIPWAVLTSDRDGDGLTDLFEERVFTDPDASDTDGDGASDFDDRLPGVAYAGGGDAASAAMKALMAAISSEKERAILPRCPHDRPGLCFGATSPGLERVLFIVGDPADWTGVDPAQRTVVLTPEQHRRAQRRFGPVYATTIEVFEVDGEGKRAVAVWNSRWQGGAARLEKSELGWRLVLRSSWIT